MAKTFSEVAEKPRILFTVDVEDYYMSPESIPVSDWGLFPDRLEVGFNRLLELMAQYKVQATFFWLGWLARRHPELVKRCHAAGHEVATHTDVHQPLNTLTPQQYREALQRSCGVLEDLTGTKVVSHRAPMWSAHPDMKWVWVALANAGIRMDSSVYPLRSYLFGDPTAPRFPYWIGVNGSRILEIPPATIMLSWMRLPLGGGGYLRALPGWYLKLALRKYRHEQQPVLHDLPAEADYHGEPVVYVHPWELDPDHPELPIKGRERRVHWIGIKSTHAKLEWLFSRTTSLSFRQAFGLVS